MSAPRGVALEARGLCKRHGEVEAVRAFDFAFPPGAITAVVGPSGSGKSTTLAMLAGLTRPDAGDVVLDGEPITEVPAEKRDFGVVFQSYALFGHLDVRSNVEFGLRVRGVARAERRRRSDELLALLGLTPLAGRRVAQISGGEQQRVALARALAYRPRVLLMDEPLSALDAQLREALRGELHALLGELGITTVYVTHDQSEALALGQQLVVMNAGRIEQTGTPLEVYTRPATRFVANFLGSANLLAGECVREGEATVLRLPFARVPLPPTARPPLGGCWAIVRPEDIQLLDADAPPGEGHFKAVCERALFLGHRLRLTLVVGDTRLTVEVPGALLAAGRFGDGVDVAREHAVRIDPARLCLLERGA